MNNEFNNVIFNHSQLRMIKTKIFNTIFKNFLTSSLRQVDLDDKSGALFQRKKKYRLIVGKIRVFKIMQLYNRTTSCQVI